MIMNMINNVDICNYHDMGRDIVSIEKWFPTYGHFKDELFNIADYININTHTNCRALLDYSTIAGHENYPIVSNLLLPTNINSREHDITIKINRLILIAHRLPLLQWFV